MDLGKRLLRRPVQTLFWLIVLVAMALLLCVGGALAYSSVQLPAVLDKHHTTVAVQTKNTIKDSYGHYTSTPVALESEQLEAIKGLDMVEMVDMRTLTGAYIPSLTAQIGLTKWGNLHAMNYDATATRYLNDSYDQVILTGTMEEVWMVDEPYAMPTNLSDLGGGDEVYYRYAYGVMEIEDILVANPAYDFFATEEYSEYCGKVFVQASFYDETGENPFREGERYIVCGSYDPSCHGRGGHTPDGGPFYPWVQLDSTVHTVLSRAFVTDDGLILYQSEDMEYDSFWGDGGYVLHSVDMPRPLASRLTGSTEKYLAEHPEWQAEIEKFTMAQHTFPVLGTECVESMQYFVTNDAAVTQGRTFTREEYDTGAKVCLISESLALTGNISAGDTITLSQYLCAGFDEGNASLEFSANDIYTTLNDPAVGMSPIPFGLTTEDEEFTVVGIYRLERSWQASAFSFTPNTVFMPQKAQIEGGFGGCSVVEQEVHSFWATYDESTGEGTKQEFLVDKTVNNGTSGVYMSLKLKNGTMQEFMDALPELGLEEHTFLTFDQGYDAAWESIHSVIAAAEKLLGIAAAGWVLLLMLYILLCQSRQRHNLGIMRSVGASPQQARRYLFFSGIVPAAVGVSVGTALSGVVTNALQGKLIDLTLAQASSSVHSGGMALDNTALVGMLGESTLPAAGLVAIAALQLAVIAAVLWLHARGLANKNTRKLLGV